MLVIDFDGQVGVSVGGAK